MFDGFSPQMVACEFEQYLSSLGYDVTINGTVVRATRNDGWVVEFDTAQPSHIKLIAPDRAKADFFSYRHSTDGNHTTIRFNDNLTTVFTSWSELYVAVWWWQRYS